MIDEKLSQLKGQYAGALRSYLQTQSESALFTISKLSKEFMGEGIGPDQVTEIHSAALSRIVKGLTRDEAVNAFRRSTEPLLEIMMNYAMAYHGDMENHKKQVTERKDSEKASELDNLAILGLLTLGMINEMGNSMKAISDYVRTMIPGGDKNAEIQQAWVNLITTAIDAMQSSGRVKISTIISHLEQQEQLVVRMVYGRNGVSPSKSMSGLLTAKESVGIDIATHISKRHQGTIKVDSNTVGTTIVLMLPVLERMENFLKEVGENRRVRPCLSQ